MIPNYRPGSFLYRFIAAVAFCATLLLPQQVEARVLAGSVTERKTNRKIESMLKAARKNYDSGKVQVALDNYWKVLELDPQETFAYLELGEIYVGLRIYDRAIELLEPGLTMAQREMDKDTICYYFCILTTAHLALNQTGQANKTLIKAAEAAPKNPMPREILGDIYLANNRVADAIKAYKKALELDPNYQPAREKLGAVVAKHGE
ncbi:MAG: TPR Domain containing protein, partial [uncultured bacterium]